jgi:GT2 family glycosyltransferase
MIKYNTMAKLKDLSVLIVTWNGDDLLANCLTSIYNVYGETLEIIVVDNANLESTKRLVSSFKNTKYIASASNLGFAGGNNLGLPACTRKYVLLLNNDTLIHEDSFSPLIDYMENNPSVAVTQGRMRLAKSGNVLDECGVMLTPAGILYDEYIMLDDSICVPTRPAHSVKGAMMMIRKDVIPLVGGLFYDHFHCNYEEKDFCHRVWMCGYEVHYVDTPAIDHLQSQTIKRMNQMEIKGQALANQIFSLGTTLEICHAIRITGTFIFLELFISLYSILKGRLSNAKEFTWCIKSLWKRRKLFYKARKNLQTNRSISDKTLFSKTMSRPGIKYYYHYFKGSLLEYRQRTAGKTEKPIPFN